jgi:uncharacterized protein YjbI with pentapeptide repeats
MGDAVTTLPIAPDVFWGLVALCGIIAATATAYWFMALMGKEYRPPPWEEVPEGARGAAIFLGLLWVGLFALTIAAAYAGVWQALRPAGQATQPNLGLGALLAALLGAPFLIWGTWLKHKATAIQHRLADLTDASMFNDKINAAVEGLYSRRQVTRVVVKDDTEAVLTEWQDDILKRGAAIDRLEGLARERPSETPRIADMLSIYVRELSREFPAKDSPRRKWQLLVEPDDDSAPLDSSGALYALDLHPDDVTIEGLGRWAAALAPCRTDMEKAAQALGRLRNIPGIVEDDVKIDLRGAMLQSFDLRSLDFREASLEGARMEGANLRGVQFANTELRKARIEGADLRYANMERADLEQARMEGADLGYAQLEWSNLSNARMDGADLTGARMDGADLTGARMKGADLTGARMDGAGLTGARMDDLTEATLRGACARSVNYSSVRISGDKVKSMFGDASVILPGGVGPDSPDWPAHWPKWKLVGEDFWTEWRKWQADPAAYIPPPPPE